MGGPVGRRVAASGVDRTVGLSCPVANRTRARAPQTYVALLRGINVGGHAKIAMADLRELLTGLGYTDVRTHLQSGNAVFRAPAAAPALLETAIAEAVEAAVGLTISVLVRTAAELSDVVARNTLPTTEPSRLMVLFLATPLEPGRLDEFDRVALAPDEFQWLEREIVVSCPGGVIESPALKVFTDKRLGRAVTARNWNTVTKVASMAAELETD
jgi:uncharacterized protein (DUF1697 family)